MSDLARDLVLEYRKGPGNSSYNFGTVILPNIQGQRYTFGSSYPGARKGEEFLFCRDETSIINPTHCAIKVDELGQYYIQNDTTYAEGRATRRSVYTTFVNSERLQGVEKRLLKVGDVISLGTPESGTPWLGPGKRPVYRVKERIIPSGSSSSSSGPQSEYVYDFTDNPLQNNLILWNIMSYLRVPDLKNARLVSNKWKEEASKMLEKKAVVSFKFDVNYVDAQFSTKVFRFLHEMRGLKIRNLNINLFPSEKHRIRASASNSFEQSPFLFSPGEPGDKMLDDLRKLLRSSHNFSTLKLWVNISKESHFHSLVHLILQELGEKLVELEFELTGNSFFLPEVLPPLPTMSKLKKFNHNGWFGRLDGEKRRWVSYIVPLFVNSLEHFTCNRSGNLELYVQEFLKRGVPKLMGVLCEDLLETQSLSLLLQLKTPLTSLELRYKHRSEPDCQMLEKLLLKNSNSLQNLKITILHKYETIDIKFPPFPKLEELDLTCINFWGATKINWGGSGALDYSKHLPSLQKLKVGWDYAEYKDNNDGELTHFIPLFPSGNEATCETVTDLCITNFLPWKATPAQEETFQSRMDKIKKMFPNVEGIKFFKRCGCGGDCCCYAYADSNSNSNSNYVSNSNSDADSNSD